jgi:hypothetical protein
MFVDIADVVVGPRFRRDPGDLDSLMRSLSDLGQLQPIVVDRDDNLLAGHRRLMAAGRLGWSRIEATVVDLAADRPEHALLVEHDENQARKDLAPSEKVAIADAIKARIGNRQGKRTDIGDGELPQSFAEVVAGVEAREVAAERAGFGNAETYRQAAAVVRDGVPGLVRAMDEGAVSISAAAAIAKLPKAEQAELVEAGPDAVRRRAATLRAGAKAAAAAEQGPAIAATIGPKPPEPADDEGHVGDDDGHVEARAGSNGSPKAGSNGASNGKPKEGKSSSKAGKTGGNGESMRDGATVSHPRTEADDSKDEGRVEGDEVVAEEPKEDPVVVFLRSLPLYSKLTGDALKTFVQDALFYNAISMHRKEIVKYALKNPPAKLPGIGAGQFRTRMVSVLRLEHPNRWLVCGGCRGSGTTDRGLKCGACHGDGYHVPQARR